MPYGYLVSVALVSVATVLSLRPVRRPGPLAELSFRVGVVLDEVPHLALYLFAASSVLAIWQGDVDSTAGRVLVGVAVTAMAGLVTLAWRGLRTPLVVRRGLTGVGISWTPRRRWPWLRILFVPFLRWRYDVERVTNLSYGDGGRRNLLDVYRHRSRPVGAPVLVHLHGGGYRGGRKSSQALPLIYRLASQGWVCVSANYRLRPSAGFAGHLADAKQVLAWVHQHASMYGGDPAKLFMSGSSAGAHLTALCALTQNDPRFQPGLAGAETSLTAAICLNGYFGHYYERPEIPSSPLEVVRSDAPPFLVAHGDLDTVVPVEQARAFAQRLRQVSTNLVVYLELPGGQHAFDLFHSPRFEAVIDGVEAFARSVMSARSRR